MTPNETNPVPTESRCAVTGDEALFSHSCPNPYDHVPPPEVGEWEERFDKTFGTRWINAEHGPGEIKSFIRSVLSSLSSAFQKKSEKHNMEHYDLGVKHGIELEKESAARKARTAKIVADADRIKKKHL